LIIVSKENNVHMKKIIMILVSFFLVSNSIMAQTWEEWFQQKKTQKKYLIQQIAALQVYFNYAKKGYNIANKGITTVSNIKNGDFNLHFDFLNSLNQVNPKIKKYTRLADIIAFQFQILKQTKQRLREIRATKQFTQDEMEYCKQVFDNLLAECIKNIDELVMVITPNTLEMKDDERLKRLDKLYVDMQDKYAFCSSFSDEMVLLSAQRLASQVEINQSKIINGLK